MVPNTFSKVTEYDNGEKVVCHFTLELNNTLTVTPSIKVIAQNIHYINEVEKFWFKPSKIKLVEWHNSPFYYYNQAYFTMDVDYMDIVRCCQSILKHCGHKDVEISWSKEQLCIFSEAKNKVIKYFKGDEE